mgnify:CR=1 FL=1
MTKKLKKCPVCGAVMYQFAPGIRCLDCEMKQAQDERERKPRKKLWHGLHIIWNTANGCHWAKWPLWLTLWA